MEVVSYSSAVLNKRNMSIKESPDFYNNYPKLFLNYFDCVSNQKMSKLSRAGYYYYYYSLLKVDSLVDDGNTNLISEIISLQERTIKILSRIFKPNSHFWILWNKRKKEYFKAVEIEKKLFKIDLFDFGAYS